MNRNLLIETLLGHLALLQERHPKKAHAVLTRLWADRAAGR